MITFAYDETTGFESINKKDTSPVMLAGIIYKSDSEKAVSVKVEPERARIIAYLRAVCKARGATFPIDLHAKRNEQNKNNQNMQVHQSSKKVKDVKKELSETLPEFIKKGTYRGKNLIFVTENGNITEKKTDKPLLRQGVYQIVVLYKSKYSKASFAENSSELQCNDIASNLYLNMSESMIRKGIFLNPYLIRSNDNEEINFDIPTRIIPDSQVNKQLRDEYRKFGYKCVKNDKEDRYRKFGYKCVKNDEEDGYRWEIMSNGHAQEIIKHLDKEIRPVNYNNIFVYSIKYEIVVDDPERFAFLYLSDSICSYLDYELKENYVLSVLDPTIAEKLPPAVKNKLTKKRPGEKYSQKEIKDLNSDDVQAIASVVKKNPDKEYTKQIRKRMNALIYNPENMFYYYGDMDSHYEEALKSALKKDLFQALSALYNGDKLFTGFEKNYYHKKWFSKFENMIAENCTCHAYKEALKKTDDYRHSDNIVQDLLLYIFETLEPNKPHNLDKLSEYCLYDIGISAYTHVGNPYKAKECFEKCQKLSDYVEDSVWRRSMNRMITVYNDLFLFKDAEQMAIGTLEVKADNFDRKSKSERKKFAKWISELLSRFRKKKDENLIDQIAPPTMRKTSYKAWSSLGQAYAFQRDKEKAELCFEQVLKLLENEKSNDYYITLSYLLHLYIDNGDRTKYETYAKDFFNGEDNIENQLTYLIHEGIKEREKSPRFSFKYALFVYIKAFYTFYKDNFKYQEVLKKLTNIEKTVKEMLPEVQWGRFLTGHPWEIIYNYSSLLESYDSDGHYDSTNRKLINSSVKSEKADIISLIIDYGGIEYKKQKMVLNPENTGYAHDYEKSLLKLWDAMVKSHCISEKGESSTSHKADVLSRCFTYMYH